VVVLAALAGCGKTESSKSAEAHLARTGSALCRNAEQERSRYIKRGGFGHEERREVFPATVKLLALLHRDPSLPKVKVLMADVRAAEEARRHLESMDLPRKGSPYARLFVRDVKAGRAELRALGLVTCVGKTAAEALLE
jgi:hypothetical protein